ncbi:carbohydrate binding domain-containing protein [Hymenobacter aerilatus]|uniref:Carbohydrate binding domain-containing protein n=1 Tax=Hymenobacter aerilatus TaxID=2932251 RepID=A0A8T9SRG1_9BACT|nr:carbohydrate binding domain-containing protein [Hymenobacter aerilatus]UOR04738.1 carbohydrate binding domain-containing protein [Hymenobacter aerilatus]
MSDTDKQDRNQLIFNDFEALSGWLPATSSLTKERAHSGQWSIKTDQQNEYSLTYTNTLETLSAGRFSKVRLSGWVYLTQLSNVTLSLKVVRSAEDDTVLFFEQIDLAELVTSPNQWVKVSKEVTLPADITSDNQLLFYMWRANSTWPT